MALLHILSLGFVIALIIIADKEAVAWIRGRKDSLDERQLRLLHALTWAGLLSLLVTGAILFWPMRDYLLSQPLFIMKLLFVGVLLVNGILIGRLMKVATRNSFAAITLEKKIPLLLSGGISFFGWTGAFALGLILFYF